MFKKKHSVTKGEGIIIGIFLLVVVASIIFLSLPNNMSDKEKEASCLEKINYSPASGDYYYLDYIDSKTFKTHEEAMRYCVEITLDIL